jgi:hypothetical protein
MNPIEILTPTLAWQMKSCPHAVGLLRQREPGLGQQRKSPPPAALGKAAHSVLEQALINVSLEDQISSDWFDKIWTAAVLVEQASCTETGPPQAWRRYSIVRRGTRRAVAELRAHALASGARPIVEEQSLWEEGKLAGRPDLVFAYEDGSAEIIDFKTGAVGRSEAQESELHQLSLYAVLVRAVYELKITKLRVVRCEGDGWSSSINESETERIYNEAQQSLAVFNDNFLNTEPLATPGRACGNCRQVLECDVVWLARPGGFEAVDGLVDSVESEAGALTLSVQTSFGPVLVVGCPNRPVKVGAIVRIAHLRKVSEGAFRWQPDRTQMAFK